jgi:hypothetical protein
VLDLSSRLAPIDGFRLAAIGRTGAAKRRFTADSKLCDSTLRQTDDVVSTAPLLAPGSITNVKSTTKGLR